VIAISALKDIASYRDRETSGAESNRELTEVVNVAIWALNRMILVQDGKRTPARCRTDCNSKRHLTVLKLNRRLMGLTISRARVYNDSRTSGDHLLTFG